MDSRLFELLEEKQILFVTTKNVDYIRNVQEIKIIRECSRGFQIISSNKKEYAGRVWEIWKKLIRCNMKNVDIVFIGFAPQLILPFFYFKLKKKVIIIDFFISVYDTLINDRNIFKRGGIAAGLSRWIDIVTLKKADHIITDTKADADYFIKEFNACSNKFETIYLEADSAVYYPRGQHKRTDLLNKFVVLYFGSILPLQGIDVVLDAVKLLKNHEDIHFQIIGPISEKYSKPIQNNVEYINWLSQEELAEYIANADLCLAGHFNGEIDKARRTIPGKAYIYEMMQKNMILGDNLANRELFKETNNHFFVVMGEGKILADKILEAVKCI